MKRRLLYWASFAIVPLLGLLVFGLLCWAAAAHARHTDAERLRFWRFQSAQIEACRRKGGFPIETWGEYRGTAGGVYNGCSFPSAPR